MMKEKKEETAMCVGTSVRDGEKKKKQKRKKKELEIKW